MPLFHYVLSVLENSEPDFGHKKRLLGSLLSSAWVLSPDGYTILPMRLPTTIRSIEIFMGGIDRQKNQERQRVLQ
jgi:hypothetical protein